MRLGTFVLDVFLLLLVVGAAVAQDRMSPIPKVKMNDAQK